LPLCHATAAVTLIARLLAAAATLPPPFDFRADVCYAFAAVYATMMIFAAADAVAGTICCSLLYICFCQLPRRFDR